MTSIFSDYQFRFLQNMCKFGVEYLVIGGRSMQAKGFVRPTHDLDVWVGRTGPNPQLVQQVLLALHVPGASGFLEGLETPRKMLVLPSQQNHEVDVLTSIGDLDFPEIYAASEETVLGGVSIRIPKLDDLIRTKQAAIASTQEQIATGECWGPGIRLAEQQIAKDQGDINLMQRTA